MSYAPYDVPLVAVFPLSPGDSTLWLPLIIFPRWQHSAYIVRPVRRVFSGSIPLVTTVYSFRPTVYS